MSFRVHMTLEAEKDVEDIYTYIAHAESPERAERVLEALHDMCRSLDEPPERGTLPKELEPAGATRFRELHHKPHRVICERIGDDVYIHCVVDGRRDMRSLLTRRLLR